jgi:hypothetical protein
LRDYPGTLARISLAVGPYTERESDGTVVTEMALAAQRPINWNAIFVRRGPQARCIDSQLEK